MNFFKFLKDLGVGFVIRVKGDVWVVYRKFSGKLRMVQFGNRRVRWWQNVLYHRVMRERLNILLKYEPNDPVYLATNLSDPNEVLALYSHRMRVEESFRDFKNGRYFSLREAGLKGCEKMGKLILVTVIAYMFVILYQLNTNGFSTLKKFVQSLLVYLRFFSHYRSLRITKL